MWSVGSFNANVSMHSMAARGDSITKLLFGARRPAADSLSCVTARHENEIIPEKSGHAQSGRRRLLDMSSREPDPPCVRFKSAEPEAVVVLSVSPYGMGGRSERLGRLPSVAALLRLAKKVHRLPATTAALTACTH
jgi:hypothetical protein